MNPRENGGGAQTGSLLEADKLTIQFGGLRAVDQVSFKVRTGEVYTIVGPNGAGKTTVFNLISRIYDVTEGRIVFQGADITEVPPHRIARMGIARTFQNIELFEHSTVLHNLLIGRHCRNRTHLWSEIFFTPGVMRQELDHRQRVERIIDLLELQHYREQIIANLPYGVRKMVELARALSTEPTLLLLDEPASGLNIEETDDLANWIDDIKNDLKITVLMIEHDMRLVSRVSDRVLAMNQGRVLAEGSPAEVQRHPEVVAPISERDLMADPLLVVRNIETFYGPIMALRGVSLEVPEGSIVTVLGANGAGKTTILKTISGIMQPSKGSIVFAGRPIQRHEPDWVARQGLAHVPEGREIFPFLTVYENLMMGAFTRPDRGAVGGDLDVVYGYFPILKERADQRAAYLSGGQQQMLVIGRGLMARPKLMLLDEPSLGLSPLLVQEIFGIIRRLNSERKVTMLLVEQNANMALQVAHHGYVLELGRIVMNDSCERLRQSEDVKEFFLGMKEEGARGRRRWKRKKTWR